MIPNNDLSIQLYSTRFASTLEEQLRFIKALGYTDVQPFFFGPPTADEVETAAAAIREHGLTAKSGHFPFEMFEDPAEIERIARTYGMSLVVIPWINVEDRPTTREGWLAIGQRLAEITDDMARRGLIFAYHNHEFEMIPLPDGSYPIDLLLGDKVPFEPDLAWIAVAGVDPLPWLQKYAGRIPAVHVKDVAPKGESLDERGFADVGHGVMDWPRLWAASVAAGTSLMVAEHDQPSDWKRFATLLISTQK